MCFDHDAVPPDLPAGLALPRLAGGAPGERIELAAADGARFSGFVAVPDHAQAGRAAVVVLPDVRGHYPFYEQLCDRLVQAGHPAVTFDYFGRTAGLGPRGDDFDYWPEVEQTTPEQIRADAVASAAALTERVGARPVVAVGFCFGGFQAFLAATTGDVPGLAGVVGFYGGLDGARFGAPSPQDEAGGTRVPLLALFGEADQGITAEQRERFAAGLAASGAEHEVVVYPEAPHSFFDRKQAEFTDASADAWRRTLAFLDARSAA